MSSTTLSEECASEALQDLLPVDPYRTLLVHYGMLLGVDDFETLDAYHRGKMWLHNGWLHRQGAVWGLDVQLDEESHEIRVLPGLAIDALGRELHLDQQMCLNVSQWYDAHQDDPDLVAEVVEKDDKEICFNAHVVLLFHACPTRQVPALIEPCDGSGSTTAYSRVYETVEILLRPGFAPQESLPYKRLRGLFGLEIPSSEIATDIIEARDAIQNAPSALRASTCLDWFRKFAALDEISLQPGQAQEGQDQTFFPKLDPAPLVLANIEGLTLRSVKSKWQLVGGQLPDTSVRSAHVATSTIQELLCGALASAMAEGPGPGQPGGPLVPIVTDAGGPRIDPSTFMRENGERYSFRTTKALSVNSLDEHSVLLWAFDKRDGWMPTLLKQIDYDTSKKQVTIELTARAGGNLVRLTVRGTGSRPLLGSTGVPFAGAIDGPPGTAHNGHDFVYMLRQKQKGA